MAILDFELIWGQQKSDFSQVDPETLNGALYVSYAESSWTCKSMLNTAIFNFFSIVLGKNPSFQNSS